MKKEDYIGSLTINNTKVDIGIDDYGQCYYFEFENDKGEIETYGCGSYNINYLDDILFMVDREGYLNDKYDIDALYKELEH